MHSQIISKQLLNMKVWIDITNSPHINFFSNVVPELKANGHEVIITCRDLSNTLDLLKLEGWEFDEIGGHAGASTLKKITYFPSRVFQLIKFLRKNKPDVAVSHSSFYSPITSWFLGVRSIYINDNEHAKGNYISFLFATSTMIPEFLGVIATAKKWNKLTSILLYPGTKESLYLSKRKIKSKGFTGKINNIYIRPEPWTAQYYKGEKFFLDSLLINLSEKYNVFLLPRGKSQLIHYKERRFSSIHIVEKALTLDSIVNDCDLFIGAGGTMTREIAILNIPTISIYQDSLLQVDKYLISNKYMVHEKKLTLKKVDKIISNFTSKPNNSTLMKKGFIAHKQLIDNIINL
jgi:uncharacterized protein